MPVRQHTSCTRCAARKVKCDKSKPCSACVKHRVDCVYDDVAPPSAKRQRVDTLPDIPNHLTQRLAHYEGLLQQHGIDARGVDIHRPPDLVPQSNPIAEGVFARQMSREDRGSTPCKSPAETPRYTRNILYESINGQALNQDNGDDPQTSDVPEADDVPAELNEYDNYAYLLGPCASPRTAKTISLYPPADEISSLWRIFKQRVDPLTKVVHVPSLSPIFDQAMTNPFALSKPQSALLCAIYSTAVLSLTDAECISTFNDQRDTLLQHYVTLTKSALSSAHFLESANLTTLQALVLHVISVRSTHSPRALWTLNGIALRIAQSMRLDRDGMSLGLTPFQTELRRRVYWAIKGNDVHIAEICGLDKFQDTYLGPDATQVPSDIGDDQLHPNMREFPSTNAAHDGISDAVFVALRGELNRFGMTKISSARSLHRTPHLDELPSSDKHSSISILRKTLEEKFIRHCDPSQPLQLLVMLVARTTLVYVEFMIHHPRQWKRAAVTTTDNNSGGKITEPVMPSAEQRKHVWSLAIRLLEHYIMTQTNSSLLIYRWHITHFVWHAIIHVLNELRLFPVHVEAEKAWNLVEQVFDLNTDLAGNGKRPFEVAVSQLCLRAFDARRSVLEHVVDRTARTGMGEQPAFIRKLRALIAGDDRRTQRQQAKMTHRNQTLTDQPQNLNPLVPESARTSRQQDVPLGSHQTTRNAIEDSYFDVSSAYDLSALFDNDNLFIDWSQFDALLATETSIIDSL